MTGDQLRDGERAGLIVFGADYAWLGFRRDGGVLRVVAASAIAAADGTAERDVIATAVPRGVMYFRATVRDGGVVEFSYSADNRTFVRIGQPFTAKPGRWVGAKVGLFAAREQDGATAGSVDVDWFRVTAAERPVSGR